MTVFGGFDVSYWRFWKCTLSSKMKADPTKYSTERQPMTVVWRYSAVVAPKCSVRDGYPH